MKEQLDDSKNKLDPDLSLKNVFYHASAPIVYSPIDFGVSKEESDQIINLRKQFINREFEVLIEAGVNATKPTIVNIVKKLYSAMAIRELTPGDHLKSYIYLCQALYLLRSLPSKQKRIEYRLYLEVNIGVQIGIVLKALSTDTYYPKMIVKAAAELAKDGRMGNWTSWITWAEYEVYDDERLGIQTKKTNEKVHKILMDLKSRYQGRGFFGEKDLHDYLSSSYHFIKYRQSPLYKILLQEQTRS
jgi:hypothetical protein